nr:hypothetical protein [Nocardia cyriacigeorgica]
MPSSAAAAATRLWSAVSTERSAITSSRVCAATASRTMSCTAAYKTVSEFCAPVVNATGSMTFQFTVKLTRIESPSEVSSS